VNAGLLNESENERSLDKNNTNLLTDLK